MVFHTNQISAVFVILKKILTFNIFRNLSVFGNCLPIIDIKCLSTKNYEEFEHFVAIFF